MYGIEALMRRTTPVEDEGVVEHSLYRTRGGACVAVFGRAHPGEDSDFYAVFLNKGSSTCDVTPGVKLRYQPGGRYGWLHVAGAEPSELDLMTRIPYDALDAL